tara:strand:- start:491 stop:751 length:261 start_codon:yes stop_codon:yes gene_type:complete
MPPAQSPAKPILREESEQVSPMRFTPAKAISLKVADIKRFDPFKPPEFLPSTPATVLSEEPKRLTISKQLNRKSHFSRAKPVREPV